MTLHRGARYVVVALVVALAALAGPAVANAQGYGLNEIGSCAIGRGFANTSAPCRDASSVYWNPAAPAMTDGNMGLVGVASIAVNGDFTQDTTRRVYKGQIPTEYPPHLFWTHKSAASRLAYGVGVYVPYGLTSQWGDDFPGRFSALKASIATIYAQPNLAWRINDRWAFGGGPIIARSSLELKQALDLATVATSSANGAPTFGQLGIARGTEFARVAATAAAWSWGFNLGIQGRLNDRWQFGARYLSKVTFNYSGDAKFTPTPTGLTIAADVPNPANPSGPPAIPKGTPVDALVAGQFTGSGALTPQGINTQLTHPQQAQVGFTYTTPMGADVSLEYAWLGWKSFKNLPVNFEGGARGNSRALIEDYNNSSTLRVGVNRQWSNGWAARMGGTVASSAAPPETVTPLLPEQDRWTFNMGAGVPLSKRWTMDAAFAHVGVWGSRGRIGERADRTSTAASLNTGWYTLNANILSLSIKATY
ncbi:MAG: OmpP1/FadL family transporter [Gemmatimonadaceae bacterium]